MCKKERKKDVSFFFFKVSDSVNTLRSAMVGKSREREREGRAVIESGEWKRREERTCKVFGYNSLGLAAARASKALALKGHAGGVCLVRRVERREGERGWREGEEREVNVHSGKKKKQ
jgi:hypothetical protein